MNKRIREQVRSYVHSDLLDEFESLAAEADELRLQLEAERDPEKAWSLALKWANAALSLTRIEAALLSGVVPILEEIPSETEDEVFTLRQQRQDAEQKVYDLRLAPGNSRPFDPEGDRRRQGEVERAREERNQVLFATGQRLEEIARANAPVMTAIGQIRTSVRALRAFQENYFPQPTKQRSYRTMSGPAPVDPDKDPLEAFADRWVNRMEVGPDREPLSEILRRAREHPTNRDWDEEKRKHIEMVRQRSLEN